MPKTFKITYRAVNKYGAVEVKAFSKYDAKVKFNRMFPQYEVVTIKEVEA